MEESKKDTIKALVKEFIERMGFSCQEILISDMEKKESGKEDSLLVDIKTTDSGFLIGQYGVNLQALQHIVRVLVREKLGEKISFVLDVNSYRKEKNDSVIRLAKEAAEQSQREKRAIILRPMSPYERRLIHMEFSQNDQVKTESIGEGEERRIVIKPINLF